MSFFHNIMTNSSTLSYIITTKNKLPYLKNRLEKLLEQKKGDEEILIADGASTDGTKEYLKELKQTGQIDYFVSEPDYGISHALNKLLLIANGTLIKLISDDDVFHYPTIETCKNFMLAHPMIDMVTTESGSYNRTSQPFVNEDPLRLVRALDYALYYRTWQKDHTPFSFCDLGSLLRRSSLPILGLYDPSFHAPDAEYSFRVTAGKASLAWYTGYSCVIISNPQSTSLTHRKKIKEANEKLNMFYLEKKPDSVIVQKLNILRNILRNTASVKNNRPRGTFQEHWPELIKIAEKWLEIKNKQKTPEFLMHSL